MDMVALEYIIMLGMLVVVGLVIPICILIYACIDMALNRKTETNEQLHDMSENECDNNYESSIF